MRFEHRCAATFRIFALSGLFRSIAAPTFTSAGTRAPGDASRHLSTGILVSGTIVIIRIGIFIVSLNETLPAKPARKLPFAFLSPRHC